MKDGGIESFGRITSTFSDTYPSLYLYEKKDVINKDNIITWLEITL